MTGPAVVVLAKAPEPGRVKTRLRPPLTPEQATDLAAAALLDTLAAATGIRTVVALTGRPARAARRADLVAALRGVTVIPQRGNGLGARVAAAHSDAAAFCSRTLQLGMDTPQVDAALLAAADATLCTPGADAVLGLAPDGGWWALGLHDPVQAALVAGVPTSRADTGERTLAALRAGGLRVALLPELTDIDTAADAMAVGAAAPGTRFAAAVRALRP